MGVHYIYIVLQNHWKGFGMYSFFYIFSEGIVYISLFNRDVTVIFREIFIYRYVY